MRPLAQALRRQIPHPTEGRIGKPQPAVAAEHGHALGKIVERFALDTDQLLEAPRQIEPLGHVVEQISHAAVRIWRGDDAQRSPVGQMPGVILGFERPISGVKL